MSDERTFDIWPPYEAFYIDSMLFSTKSALLSVLAANRRLDRSLEWEKNPEVAIREQDAILDSIQNIVLCGAAISRYFWPARSHPTHEARARKLRSSLGVAASSPLRSRELRNLLEHFDEKLDNYFSGGIAGIILPAHVGAVPPESNVPYHLFRAYYTDDSLFEVLGQRFAIQPIIDEIVRIHGLLLRYAENGRLGTPEDAG